MFNILCATRHVDHVSVNVLYHEQLYNQLKSDKGNWMIINKADIGYGGWDRGDDQSFFRWALAIKHPDLRIRPISILEKNAGPEISGEEVIEISTVYVLFFTNLQA